jgi:hypothetical protein
MHHRVAARILFRIAHQNYSYSDHLRFHCRFGEVERGMHLNSVAYLDAHDFDAGCKEWGDHFIGGPAIRNECVNGRCFADAPLGYNLQF